MSKLEALQIIKLLSALESWSFAKEGLRMPDYLYEQIADAMAVLTNEVMK